MNTVTQPLRILLADDHTLVRAGIRALLERIPNLEIVGEANDGREVLDLLRDLAVDIILMDIAMPGLNGLDTTARVNKDFPQTRVIILSMHHNEEYFWQALKAGASGYLLKKAATAELQTALQQVVNGEVYLSQEISARIDQNKIAETKSPLERLSERQRETLQLIAEGHNTKTIAFLLKVSPKTVEYHRSQIMARLGIYDVPGLVRYAIQVGLTLREA
jgi:DNA-binding NarL/FixJ family response regulator